MPFLPPNQQCQSTEGMSLFYVNVIIIGTGTETVWEHRSEKLQHLLPNPDATSSEGSGFQCRNFCAFF